MGVKFFIKVVREKLLKIELSWLLKICFPLPKKKFANWIKLIVILIFHQILKLHGIKINYSLSNLD